MPSRSASPAAPPAEDTQDLNESSEAVQVNKSGSKDSATSDAAKDDEKGSGSNEDDGSADEPEVPSESASPSATASATTSTSSALTSGDWQAIWSPTHNAYYFFNSKTQQTTWTNPLQPSEPNAAAPGSGSTPSVPSSSIPGPAGAIVPPHLASVYAAQAAAAAQGIDPALAYLDPALASVGGPAAAAAGGYGAMAKFNARTGAFTKVDARDPSHLSEFERAKRMSEAYFDVGAWEQDVEKRKAEEAEEEEAGGRKKKKPTKKDLVSAHYLFV